MFLIHLWSACLTTNLLLTYNSMLIEQTFTQNALECCGVFERERERESEEVRMEVGNLGQLFYTSAGGFTAHPAVV